MPSSKVQDHGGNFEGELSGARKSTESMSALQCTFEGKDKHLLVAYGTSGKVCHSNQIFLVEVKFT
jgi:hypothetical protein